MSDQARQQADAASLVTADVTGLLQRTCACGNHTASGECDNCQKKRKGTLQRSAVNSGPSNSVPSIVDEVLRSPGQPLDRATRAFFEPRFGHDLRGTPVSSAMTGSRQGKLTVGEPGTREELEADRMAESVTRMSHPATSDRSQQAVHDFGQVRIHTDARAAESARAVNAKAYTVGRDIVFAGQQYAPETSVGRSLIAHELTHTIQQAGGSSRSAQLQRTIGDGHDLQSPRFAGDSVLEACFDDEQLLRFGSRGPAVEKIQQALIDAGFPLPVFGVDGIFESETAGAVRDYQRARGLVVDALVGPITMGTLDAEFAAPGPPAPAPPAPAPPAPAPPAPAPPAPAPPGPAPAPPAPAPAPPGPAPAPPGPAPAPPGPAPAPPGPAPAPPAPAETITSETVVADPAPRTRTKIGVGERVNLTHAPGAAAWTRTAGSLSVANGDRTVLTAPDTAQAVTVTAGAASIVFDVIAPDDVHMDPLAGTGIRHTVDRADSGIATQPFLLPDTVNFNRVVYREMNVGSVVTDPGAYSCFPNFGHCRRVAGGACPDLTMTDTVLAGKGTQALRGDCVYSGDCVLQVAPFVPGSIIFDIPYEYKVGAGAFRQFKIVHQESNLAANATTLNSDKAGAHGDTTVAAGTGAIAGCN
jgi:peptidoglycan hydrolase-like protein with peptidoglycan-binding domain